MDSSLTAAKLCDFGITISVADVSATAGDQGTPMYQPLPSVLHTAFAYSIRLLPGTWRRKSCAAKQRACRATYTHSASCCGR
jgi:hypothetical protein